MYIDNVRNSIEDLDEREFEEYIKRLRSVLKRTKGKNVKPSVLKKRVNKFVEGKDPKIDYFESYLLTFDELSINGAINAIQNRKIVMPKTWRQLLVTVTDDLTLPSDITKHLENEHVLLELKILFFKSIRHCQNKNKDRFSENLHAFNQFLQINNP
jgi:hypothetical protein